MNENHKKIIDKHMVALINDMDVNHVAINLQSKLLFSDHDVETIMAERTDMERRRRLLVILKTKGYTAFNFFVEALQETNQKHLSDLLGSANTTATSGSTPSTNLHLKVQKALKDMYLERFKKIRPFSLPFTFDIENTWVSLALREDNNQSKETEDHAELLKNAFEKEKMLIIEGKPATGKTSLMRRLAYEWATMNERTEKRGLLQLFHKWVTGKKVLPNFDLVVYAQFRDVRKQEFETIADLVIEYNKKYMERDEHEIFSSLLHNKNYCKQKQVLVLLDGYDESSLQKQCNELTEYLTAITIRKTLLFNIVLTARPGYLGQHRGNSARYIFADVLGFITEDQKQKYIYNHFRSFNTNNMENIAAVHQLLRRNENINKLAETPLFLTFICLVHEKIVDGTILELYCNIVWWLIDRHQKDFPDRDIPGLFEFSEGSSDKFKTIQNNYLQFPQLLNLGKMAFNNLKKNVFEESDCMQYSVKEIIQQVGLLRKDEFYDNSFQLTNTFSFPHRTMQEFLAAIYRFRSPEQFHEGFESYLVTQTMKEYEKFLLRIALSDKIPIDEKTRKHYFDVIEYLHLDEKLDALYTSYGINVKLVNRLLSQCNNILSLQMFNCILEANSEFSFRNSVLLRKLILSNCTIHRSTMLGIAQLTAIDTLKFDGCNIDIEAWQSIIEEIRKSSVKCLDLSFNGKDFNNEYVNQLQKCNNIIIKMIITDYTIWSEDLLSFSGIYLHSLAFFYCSFEANSQLSFKDCPAIDTLDFHACNIDMEAWQSIVEELRESSVRYLKFTFHGKDFNNEYINQLQKCNSIVIKIQIKDYIIRSKDLLSFSETDFHSLAFFYCSFEANSQLSFKDCPAIDTLEFHVCHIDLETWHSVVEEIRKSFVKRLKFTPDYSNYLESVQKCDQIEEIHVLNDWRANFKYEEDNIVPQLIELARNMLSLQRIVFDFTKKGKLKDSNKELIEKAGQERDPNFAVSIIPDDNEGDYDDDDDDDYDDLWKLIAFQRRLEKSLSQKTRTIREEYINTSAQERNN